MDLTQLANLGEFIGGAAVLVTLVYLALQVRSNTRSSDFLIEQGVITEFNRVNAQVVQNPELARLFKSGSEGAEELTPEGRIRYDLLMGEYMNVHQMIFELGSKGVIPRRLPDATVFEISQYRELPGARESMRGGAFFFSPEFCALWGVEAGFGRRLGDRDDDGT